MHTVVHHVITGAEHRFGLALVEGDHRVRHRSTVCQGLLGVREQRCRPALEPDLGDALVLGRQVGQIGRLVQGQAERLLDEQVDATAEQLAPHRVHVLRLADRVHSVRCNVVEHLLVIGEPLLDAVRVGGAVHARLVKITDRHHLGVRIVGQRRVVNTVGHGAGADHGDAYRCGGVQDEASFSFGTLSINDRR